MKGKKRVLEPHCIEVAGDMAKANLFRVPGGYVIPVVFGNEKKVTVTVRNIPGLQQDVCKAIYPGSEVTTTLQSKWIDGALEIQVPLNRGCAMVKIEDIP